MDSGSRTDGTKKWQLSCSNWSHWSSKCLENTFQNILRWASCQLTTSLVMWFPCFASHVCAWRVCVFVVSQRDFFWNSPTWRNDVSFNLNLKSRILSQWGQCFIVPISNDSGILWCARILSLLRKLRLGERLFTSVRDALEIGARFSYGPPVVHMYKIDTGFLILQGILIGTVFFSSTFYGFHGASISLMGVWRDLRFPKKLLVGACIVSCYFGAHCGWHFTEHERQSRSF